MNWLLVIWIFTGEYHNVQTIEFSTYEQCEAVEVWMSEVKNPWTKRYQPKTKCFRKNDESVDS